MLCLPPMPPSSESGQSSREALSIGSSLQGIALVARARALGPYPFFVGSVLLAGCYLRLYGYFELGFWSDEATWAQRIFRGDTTEIRPPGYVVLSEWLGTWHNSEPVLRLPSLLAGLASLPLFLVVCRRSGLGRWSSAAGLMVLCLHRAAITLSKEFKPYALELGLHLAILALALGFLRSGRRTALVGLCALGVLSPLLAWSVAMLLPCALLYVFVDCLKNRSRTDAGIALLGGLACAAVLLGVLLLKVRGGETNSAYWGHKYDVFFTGHGVLRHGTWLLRKTVDLLIQTGRVRFAEPFGLPVSSLSQGVQGLLGLWGLLSLFGAEPARRALWGGPVLLALVLGAAGMWPYGPFRTNLFLLGYAILFVAAGAESVETLLRRRRWAQGLGLAALSSYLALAVAVPPSRAAAKSMWGQAGSVRQALRHVRRELGPLASAGPTRVASGAGERPPSGPASAALIMDGPACAAFEYYTTLYEHAHEWHLDDLRDSLSRVCIKDRLPQLQEEVRTRGGEPYWLVTAQRQLAAGIRRAVKRACPGVDFERELPGETVVMHCPGDS